ncbi:MAG: NAD(P)/FAD-dependent oxidoreductase [Acidobacteriia bacterium]|nr:NAD(P)/FAD-dependent oxidoreductase [Terriglobia bacterium]
MTNSEGLHRVVIVGGGFGGLNAVQHLKRAPVRITLIDKRNFHLFQPLLYQVATGGLSPANIASPLRSILRSQKNVEVVLGEMTDLDVEHRRIILKDGSIDYDTLVLAVGAENFYFGHNEWAAFAPGLKSIEDATWIRRKILLAFESAERETNPQSIQAWLTFVIVGGGATGVELAGALAEIANITLKDNFRHIDPSEAHIILLEGGERLLPAFPPSLSQKAKESLNRLRVEVLTQALAQDITTESVTVRLQGETRRIATRTVLWAAGVRPSPLANILSKKTGVPLDRAGRILIQRDLTVPGHPEIFAIGDLVNLAAEDGKPLPGVAPVAIQQGSYVAQVIQSRLRRKNSSPFYYRDKGNLATIGRAAAVAVIKNLRFSGYLAWLTWLFVHLMYIVEFENRLLVFLQWAWNYFTLNRSARLITGVDDSEVEPPRGL